MEYNLDRYLKAQKYDYEIAKKELLNGHKKSHWMWYIFPQIKGLGHSYDSHLYGLDGLEEAEAYYNHEILGTRLKELCNILLSLDTNDAYSIFGDPDDKKLRSSMTIFLLATNDKIFQDVLDKFYDGKLDKLTVGLINNKLIC